MNSTPSQDFPNNVNWLKQRPIAHRGLHDVKKGVYENTLSAAKAACDAGYSIEVDLQFSSDGVPVVFHDFDLSRLTNREGEIRDLSWAEIKQITIMDSEETIPSLEQLLNLIQGQSGIVLEFKGKIGSDANFVEAASKKLEDYKGDIAIMSFDHHILKEARAIAPHLPLGLTAEGDDKVFDAHMDIAKETDIDFISYALENLGCRFVSEFMRSGKPAISWTIRSTEEAELSAKYVDQITFEGFLA